MDYKLYSIPFVITNRTMTVNVPVGSKMHKIVMKEDGNFLFLMLVDINSNTYEDRKFIFLNIDGDFVYGLKNNEKLVYIDTVEIPSFVFIRSYNDMLVRVRREDSYKIIYSIFEIVDIQREFEF